MFNTYPYPYDSGGGWTCPQCGAYVGAGMFHYHYNDNPLTGVNIPYNQVALLERIANALERIANTLEKNV